VGDGCLHRGRNFRAALEKGELLGRGGPSFECFPRIPRRRKKVRIRGGQGDNMSKWGDNALIINCIVAVICMTGGEKEKHRVLNHPDRGERGGMMRK